MSEKSEKELLVEKAVAAGLGDAKTFANISEANVAKMVAAVEERDGKISTLKKKVDGPVSTMKSTTVKDLIAKKRVKVATVPVDPDKEDEE